MSNHVNSQAQTINEQAINALNSRLPKGFKVVGDVENHSARLLVNCSMELSEWVTLCDELCDIESSHSDFPVFERLKEDLIMAIGELEMSIQEGELS